MSTTIINALKSELARVQKKIDKLESLINKNHLSVDDAKAMDEFAAKFNASKSGDEKIKVYEENIDLVNRWDKSVAAAKHQAENSMKWHDEFCELCHQRDEFIREISKMEFYQR